MLCLYKQRPRYHLYPELDLGVQEDCPEWVRLLICPLFLDSRHEHVNSFVTNELRSASKRDKIDLVDATTGGQTLWRVS